MYIQGDLITSNISTVQIFPIEYFNTYIKNFTDCNNIIFTNVSQTIYLNEPLIFITKIEYLDYFCTKILPLLDIKFVLLTHYGDLESGKYDGILNHPKLIKWYGLNMSIISDKTEGLPLGLESKYWGRTNFDIIQNYNKKNKNKLLYLNFSLQTNPKRSEIMNSLLKKGFTKNNNLSWNEYVQDLSEHKFSISPKGNGIDCHRHWESLYLGVIPIIEKSTHMSFFNDLPILFVDNYDIITNDYLNKKYEEFKLKKFNLNKLDLNYWNEKIKSHFISS